MERQSSRRPVIASLLRNTARAGCTKGGDKRVEMEIDTGGVQCVR